MARSSRPLNVAEASSPDVIHRTASNVPVKYTVLARGIAELASELRATERSIYRGLLFVAVAAPIVPVGFVGMLIFLLCRMRGGSGAIAMLLGVCGFLLVFVVLAWQAITALKRYHFARAALDDWATRSGFKLVDGAHFRWGEWSCAVCLSGTTVDDDTLTGFTFLCELTSNATLAGEVAHKFAPKSDLEADFERAWRALADQRRSELLRIFRPR
jgi:hypothetical protein